MSIHRAAVLITSHNRRSFTLAALDTLFRQRRIGDLETDVFLVDDGCTDGTVEAVRSRFPSVHLLRGDGTLYWNRGMHLAFAVAMTMGFDAYIFFNDDTFLYKDALERLVSLARERLAAGAPAIVAGSTRSPRTGKQSYGGMIKTTRGLSVSLEMVDADPARAIECDTMNGNFALIPAEIAAVVGNLEEQFQHQFGDLDYGLRAKAAGFEVIALPGYVGDCSDNDRAGTWRDKGLRLADRWRHLMSPKGVPPREWELFARRHFGWRQLAYIPSPYLRTLVSGALFDRSSRRAL